MNSPSVRIYVAVVPETAFSQEMSRLAEVLAESGQASDIAFVAHTAPFNHATLDSCQACVLMAARESPPTTDVISLFRACAATHVWVYQIGDSNVLGTYCPGICKTTLTRFFSSFVPLILKATRFKARRCGI